MGFCICLDTSAGPEPNYRAYQMSRSTKARVCARAAAPSFHGRGALQNLRQTALVPAWLKVCCPNARKLEVGNCTLTPYVLDLPPAPPGSSTRPSAGSGPEPMACQRLQHIFMTPFMDDGDDSREQWQQHIRQQLAALPSLTSLSTHTDDWMLEPALVSTSLMSLYIQGSCNAQHVSHLAVQFPNLRQLDASLVTWDDAGLEALLHLPHLERLTVEGFNLQRSHAHRAWAVQHLSVWELDVGAFARLPLERVQTCTLEVDGWVKPSGDAQAVARVAEAVRRWGGLGTEGWMELSGRDVSPVLATLGPLLAALPAAQRRDVGVDLGAHHVGPATLRALGQQLPGSVATLSLTASLQPEAWPTLLPSLPATVTDLWLSSGGQPPTEEHLVSLCSAAVRRIKVTLRWPSPDAADRVSSRLAERGREQLVTLVRMP